MTKFEPSRPVIVISPHLDDAVLSCALFLDASPGATVVTVMAGAPDVFHEGYNSMSTGEPYAPDAVNKRRDEDTCALTLLSAENLWLGFHDKDYLDDYRTSENKQLIRESIKNMLDDRRPGAVLAPLGLIHADHLVVSNACLELAINSEYEWYFYMDLPYGYAKSRPVPRRIENLATKVNLDALELFSGEPRIKRKAMRLYESQYGILRRSHRRGFRTSMRGPEQYWKITGPALG
jgi:LmbE family N-acetylglucosaminyl deacetylase